MAHRRSVEVVRESTSEETSFISVSEYLEKNDALYDHDHDHDMLGNYPIMKTQSQDMEETAQLHMETNGRNSRKEAK